MRLASKGALVAAALLALLVFVVPAFGYDEPHSQPELGINGHHDDTYNCPTCHRPTEVGGSEDCYVCHNGTMFGTPEPVEGKGPHGTYSRNSDRCSACHEVHAAGGILLLPQATITATCNSCHDGTGGRGVFGAIAARGLTVGARHRIDTTSVVPGGDAATGGSATMAFGGAGGNLGCDDCHSPHGSSTVASFTPERKRTSFDHLVTLGLKTDRLLRQRPGDSAGAVTVYGSDWCLACHRGRSSGGAVHNHPVDSNATTSTPFYYERTAILSADTTTSTTVLGTMARTNRGYLMPYPRTAEQAGHAPTCQQCHEDSRFVGVLTVAGNAADAATFSVTATDGLAASDNPRFQNFPHETVNPRFTVETSDDLCTNCHPPAVLP